ncbi:hypothetical protein [Parabacteroides sp. FAFU027]|uniref:hypothetical protein n=1 Tax=Parabacteroides sp. FAFU027 TaxID=2922715 RepID=UPI001FAFE8A8|nr:hypothetical protein [Parabacteroides sp. FAFU027]
MANKKIYSCTDIEMVTASLIIAGHFEEHFTELSPLRGNWTPDYLKDLKKRINDTSTKYVSSDNLKGQRDATYSLQEIQSAAKNDVAFFKTQVEEDFRDNPSFCSETLKTLSIEKYIRDVQRGSHEALSALLIGFNNGMTEALRQSVTAKGINGTLIDRIISYTDAFQTANVTQEIQKSTSKSNTQEATDALNGIYTEIISICKYASKHYKNDKLRKDRFTFGKVVAQLSGGSKPSSGTTPTDNPTT